MASLWHITVWRQIYIEVKSLDSTFPVCLEGQKDIEEEASVLIVTTHHYLSFFTSFLGFHGERIAVKGLIAPPNTTLKVVGKQETRCLTNQIVCKNKQRPKFKLVSLSLGHLAVFVCVCFIGTSCKLYTVTEGTRRGSRGRVGAAVVSVPSCFHGICSDVMWKACRSKHFHQPGRQNEAANRMLSLHCSNHKTGKGQDPAELKKGFFSTSFLNCSLEDSL